MKVCAISDTHTMLSQVDLPKADLLLIGGDITYTGSPKEMAQFAQDLRNIRSRKLYRQIILTPGNHELTSEDNPTWFRSMIDGLCIYLHDDQFVFEGVKVYASGWTPYFHHWAWNLDERDHLRDYAHANRVWNKIPDDTKILLTHGPPRNILDLCNRDERVGDVVLRKRVFELADTGNLRYHCFGHIHRNLKDHKTEVHQGVTFANVAICDEKYKPVNPAFVFEI